MPVLEQQDGQPADGDLYDGARQAGGEPAGGRASHEGGGLDGEGEEDGEVTEGGEGGHASLPPAGAVREVTTSETAGQVTHLISWTEPARPFQRLLQDQGGAVGAHAVRRESDAVICRLRFRLP